MISILINLKKKSIIFLHLKIIILLILYIFILLLKEYKTNKNKISVCICTIAKLENLYIREYINHYKNLGIDKIYIYDNNEITGEIFDVVISDYIAIKYVSIINYRGILKPQLRMMKSCYEKNKLKYDWIIFNDIDEFLYLKNYSNIKNYLNEFKFHNCKIIYLNEIFYSDNNKLYYENKPVMSRFTERLNITRYRGKAIIRGNLPKFGVTSAHIITENIPRCNGFGKINKTFNVDSKYYYYKHYSFKSTEEYCNKLNKGNVRFYNTYHKKYSKIVMYFVFNRITKQKIDMFENRTGIKLNYFRKKLKNYNLKAIKDLKRKI